MPKPTLAEIAVAVTTYEMEKRKASVSEKEKTKAKKLILEWLGTRDSAKLPDGRIVSTSTIQYEAEAEPRAAHSATSLVITHPLPPK